MIKVDDNAFFPIPSFLRMPSFGIDISDESLKFIELKKTKKGIRLGKYGENRIPNGVIENGRVKDPFKFQEIVLSVKKEHGINYARVSLVENQIYSFSLKLPKEGLESVRGTLELLLEEHIPIPGPEAIFDYDIIEDRGKELFLQVAAIPKAVINDYLMVFKDCGILVHSFELEAQAIGRSVIKKGDTDTYMIVDFGEKRTGIFIISNGIVRFTSTVDIGGAFLTDMIQKNFKIDIKEAEKVKKKYGLQRNTENPEIFSVLLNSVSALRDEIVKHFIYWQTHEDDDGNKNPLIKKVILCGGDSNLVGFPDYLALSTKTQIEMANVWTNILDTNEYIPEINFKKALSFASGIGLALGNFEHD